MKKRKGAAQQLPYADRLLLQKQQKIADERQDAAETVVKLVCLTLNEMEGWAFLRLSRFAVQLMENVKEFYSDRERMEYWVNKRFDDMGFIITPDGDLQAATDADGNPVKKEKKQ